MYKLMISEITSTAIKTFFPAWSMIINSDTLDLEL